MSAGPAPEDAEPAPRPWVIAARVHAAPAARRRATDLGVDLEAVKGTGPGGLIRAADVEAAASGSVIRRLTPETT